MPNLFRRQFMKFKGFPRTEEPRVGMIEKLKTVLKEATPKLSKHSKGRDINQTNK